MSDDKFYETSRISDQTPFSRKQVIKKNDLNKPKMAKHNKKQL